jgi:peptide/nickel transport system permease protein
MIEFVARRLAHAGIVLFLVSLIAFFMVFVLPGDPVLALLGPGGATEEFIEAKRAELGLDQPVVIQYARWITRVIQGDLGQSIRTGIPVLELILDRAPVSIYLMSVAVALALVVAIPLGVLAARHPMTWVDSLGTFLSVAGVAIPNFWLAIMLLLVFSVNLGWLPSFGLVLPWDDLGLSVRQVILPAAVLATGLAAEMTRHLRSSMLDVKNELYVVAARAKGLREITIELKHTLRNALIPVITLLGMRIGRLIGGAVVIEVVFGITGIGQLAINAINARDAEVVLGVVVFGAGSVVLINSIIDLTYGVIDPRIRTI